MLPAQHTLGNRSRAQGLTLIEVLVALTVLSVLLAVSAPSAVRTMEQAHADMAGANLHAICNAQRYYWLQNRTYAADLATLVSEGLLDQTTISGTRYTYAVDSSDTAGFVVSAQRTGSSVWSGQFDIDETDTITGSVLDGGYTITPGFD